MVDLKTTFPASIPIEDISRIFDALGAGHARLVGGCVRNILLKCEVLDIDIATSLTPDETLARLERAKIKTIPTGLKHGTVTAVIDGTPFEITSLRVDLQSFGRQAEVQFTEDWHADAQRRDFYINALYADLDGQIYDPTGHGLKDISEKRVRFIGDAAARIQEDYLRILRFYRFSAHYSVNIDFEGASACEKLRTGLKTLSAERIWSELKKILMAPKASAILAEMDRAQIGQTLHPDFLQYTEFKDIFETLRALKADVLLCFSTLLPFDLGLEKSAIEAAITRFRLSNAEAQTLNDVQKGEAWQDLLKINIDNNSIDNLRQWAYIYGLRRAQNLILMAKAHHLISDALWVGWLSWDQQLPTFPLTGDDLIRRGYQAGARLGQTLRSLEAEWIASNFDDGALKAAWDRL